MNSEILISFPDQSKSFCCGVEYGRLLQKFQNGYESIYNDGFPIHIENRDVLNMTCKTFGYIPLFGSTYYNEWIDFIAIKITTINN